MRQLLAILLAFSWSAPLPEIGLPIKGLALGNLRDTFDEQHSGHPHEAIDIPSPRGTPVYAVVAGTIQKLFLSRPGGITIYEFDDSKEYSYYYAHLESYVDGLKEGMRVKQGELMGYVGSTGNADAKSPHLHFAIFELGPEKNWWQGKAINPYQALQAAVRKATPATPAPPKP